MALQQKLDEGDIALLEIVEDPIFFGEFLRTTNDGEIDKKLWPQMPWKYRDYQRQFLSDRSEFVVYTGGRSIGKCSPGHARIYTTQGYKKLSEVAKENAFVVYTLTPEMTLEQRRAVCIPDKRDKAYTIQTETGYEFIATGNHPILTPTGYKLVSQLNVDDYVAVTTHLPHESTQQAFGWHELRIFGYIALIDKYRVEQPIKPRWKAIGKELEYIADQLLVNWYKSIDTGEYTLVRRKKSVFPHPITSLLRQLKLHRVLERYGIIRRIPQMIKNECLENIQVMLEALFSQHATLSAHEIKIKVTHELFAQDLRELLLRFGIETRINGLEVSLLDERAIYRFWNTFQLPGIGINKIKPPLEIPEPTTFMRFDRIIHKYQSREDVLTYAVHVYEHNNYIGDYLFVHNSVVLEDKIVHEVVNADLEFPVTKESVLVTPNQAQMTPLLGKLITRFSSSKFLKDYLQGNVNRSEGTMKFPIQGKDSKPMLFNFRIAGSKGENNMVGLHLPRIRADETQLFPLNAWTQLMPALNQ